ncbi:hypothetical protein DFH08DRAFT_1026399 [Mycena albidolilacea]|uniref:Uncharacterized protein n=1 Tax=Mycena albidolilacea TaxID=1033008 RepID=A0AAD6ZKR1_9AGAR|nr:hypothetical protein DFH08DRAFT_1026399 [Mycena albidolilacea]
MIPFQNPGRRTSVLRQPMSLSGPIRLGRQAAPILVGSASADVSTGCRRGLGTHPAVAAGADADELQVAESRLEQSLRPALDSLKNFRTVLWIFTSCPDQFRWTVETVHGFMSSLALLEDFRLASDVSGFARNYGCSFDRITHLRKLSLTSSDALSLGGLCRSASHMVGNNPHFSALHLATDHHWDHPLLHDFTDFFDTAVQPLRLAELHLFRGNPEMWDTLRAERIPLSELHTDLVVEGLSEYISSYSGLERLTIVNTADEDVDLAQFDRLADNWSFGGHNVGVLEQLHKLQSLRVNVNSVVAGYKPSAQTGGTGRGARPIIKIESDEDGRHLRKQLSKYRGIVIGEIDKSVREFKSRGSRTLGPAILAGCNYYKVEGSEGLYCAVESANLSWPYSYDHPFGKRS